MGWDGDCLAKWGLGAQYDVTSCLPDFPEVPPADQVVGEVSTVDIARNLQATFKTSSRIRWRRMLSGGSESKK